VARLQVQRPELVHTEAPAALRPPAVQRPDAPVLLPEERVGGLLPGLGPPPPHLQAAEQGAQPLPADAADDALLGQVLPQLVQRPAAHADKRLGGRQGHLGDLLDQVGGAAARGAAGVQVGIPSYAVEALGVEAVDDGAGPLRGAAGPRGDGAVAQAAARQQHDAGVPAVDGVGALALEIGARVVAHVKYITFQLAEVAVPRKLLARTLGRIARLRPACASG
jgi:hypothetical protein